MAERVPLGSIYTIGGTSISWVFKMVKSSSSTMEVEYVVVTEASKEMASM